MKLGTQLLFPKFPSSRLVFLPFRTEELQSCAVAGSCLEGERGRVLAGARGKRKGHTRKRRKRSREEKEEKETKRKGELKLVGGGGGGEKEEGRSCDVRNGGWVRGDGAGCGAYPKVGEAERIGEEAHSRSEEEVR